MQGAAEAEQTQVAAGAVGSDSDGLRGQGGQEAHATLADLRSGDAEEIPDQAIADVRPAQADRGRTPKQEKHEQRQGLYVVPGGRSSLDVENEPAAVDDEQDASVFEAVSAAGAGASAAPDALTSSAGKLSIEAFAAMDEVWFEQFSRLSLGGVAQALASHLHWVGRDESCVLFKMDPEYASLMGDQQIARLEAALSEAESTRLSIQISVGEVDGASPAQIASYRKARALANAKADLEQDQRVQTLMTDFGATIVEGSVRPKVNEGDR